MTIMAIIAVLLVVALIVTVVKIAQHQYTVALGTFGLMLIIVGFFFYAQEWRARAYEVIGDPISLNIVASADVYNGIAIAGMLLLALAGAATVFKGNKRARKVRKRSTAVSGNARDGEFASDEEVSELLGTHN